MTHIERETVRGRENWREKAMEIGRKTQKERVRDRKIEGAREGANNSIKRTTTLIFRHCQHGMFERPLGLFI